MSAAITVHVVEADGNRRTLEGRAGQSLMRVAVSQGIEGIVADCGGCMTCATCHVFVDDAWRERAGPPSPEEDDMLDLTAVPRGPNSRLSCQIALDARLDGLVVHLPETQY